MVFDSNAILLYLADRAGRFVPTDLASRERGEMLSWLMFVASGIGPYSGQAVHFRNMAPEPKEYALNRYDFEAHRHWKILDDRLATQPYLVGNQYSIVDMAVWGLARLVPFVLGIDNPWGQYPQVKRLLDEITARPAAQRVEKLRTAHAYKTELDEEARRNTGPVLHISPPACIGGQAQSSLPRWRRAARASFASKVISGACKAAANHK